MLTRFALATVLCGGCTAMGQDVSIAGHVYINMATGERVFSPFETQDGDPQVWLNSDGTGNGSFAYEAPLCDSDIADTEMTVGWGELGGVEITCFQIVHATSIAPDVLVDEDGDGCPDENSDPTTTGLDVTMSFYEGTTGFGELGELVTSITVPDIPGGTGNPDFICAWVLTIDLAGTGEEFVIDGPDADGDGEQDFGYGYSFNIPEDVEGSGVGLVFNAGSDGPIAVPIFDRYCPQSTGAEYITSEKAPADATPWLILFGVPGGGEECVADCTGDGQLNILDFVCYEGLFVECGPPDDCSGCDVNGDGFCNVLDFVAFQTAFAAGCP